MERVGIVLDRFQCFSHGQLYVGASRVRRSDTIKFLIRPDVAQRVTNVAQKRIVDEEDIAEAKDLQQFLEGTK